MRLKGTSELRRRPRVSCRYRTTRATPAPLTHMSSTLQFGVRKGQGDSSDVGQALGNGKTCGDPAGTAAMAGRWILGRGVMCVGLS